MVKNHSRISLCLIQGHTAISVAILNPITDLFTGSSEDRVQADQVKENTTTTTTTNTSSDRNTSSPSKQTTPSATTSVTSKQPTNTSGSNTRVSYSTFILLGTPVIKVKDR